jgi:hypothetical protein
MNYRVTLKVKGFQHLHVERFASYYEAQQYVENIFVNGYAAHVDPKLRYVVIKPVTEIEKIEILGSISRAESYL